MQALAAGGDSGKGAKPRCRRPSEGDGETDSAAPSPGADDEPSGLERLAQQLGNARMAAVLVRAGYTSPEAVGAAPDEALLAIDGVSEKALRSDSREAGVAQEWTWISCYLKSALISLLGASYAIEGWEDSVLTEALSQGLADANVWLPPVEASFPITEARLRPGHLQPLADPGAGRGLPVGGRRHVP